MKPYSLLKSLTVLSMLLPLAQSASAESNQYPKSIRCFESNGVGNLPYQSGYLVDVSILNGQGQSTMELAYYQRVGHDGMQKTPSWKSENALTTVQWVEGEALFRTSIPQAAGEISLVVDTRVSRSRGTIGAWYLGIFTESRGDASREFAAICSINSL